MCGVPIAADQGIKVVPMTESQSPGKAPGERTYQAPSGFYRGRSRFYTFLLLFVVVVGLPILGVPQLRQRLSARIMFFKTAVAGNVVPVVARVGANPEPFPSEYEKPEPPVRQAYELPPPAAILTHTPTISVPAAPNSSPIRAATELKSAESRLEPEGEESAGQSGAEAEEPEAAGPKYQQGKIEQEAYDLVLQSNAKIADLVHGSNPSLHFVSWDVAQISNDIFWVRLKFQAEGSPDREYIWQVKLSSKEVTPLSYHARSIS